VDEEIANIQPQELLDNDHYLRDAIGDLGQDLTDHETDVSNPHNVTHAQTGPEAADPTKTTTSRHKHVSDADLKQVYDTKSDLAAHENDNENPHLVTHAQTGPEGATSGTNTAKDKHVSDADYKRWEDHLANKSNPHEVTHDQVGPVPVEYGPDETRDKHISNHDFAVLIDHLHSPGAHGSTRVESSEDNGCILIDGVKTTVYTHPDTHPASMITGLHSCATTGVAGSVAWDNVTGKPSTFTPSSHSHNKYEVGLGNVLNYGIATQAQAEAGTANDAYMTPLRVKEAISSLAPVKSVAGKTGAVTLSKSDVGLGSVQNYGIATKAQAEAGTANNVYMTPLRVAEAFNNRVVFAQVNQVVPSNKGTVIKIASSPTDYNTIKFDTLLPAGEDTAWLGVIFPSLGDVVVGTPQYHLSESSYLSSPALLEFSLFHTLVKLQLRDISIHHGIEMFRQNQVSFVLTRASGTGALNDIYLHFRFTGLKLA
jgi:hypothetical protein